MNDKKPPVEPAGPGLDLQADFVQLGKDVATLKAENRALKASLERLIALITDLMQGMNDVRLVKAIREKFKEVYGKLDDFANRSTTQDELFAAFMYTVLHDGIN